MRRATLLAALIVAALVAAVLVLRDAYHGPMSTRGAVVLLRPGTGARGVAAQLAEQGVLEYPRLFLLFARLTEVDRQLRAGRYAVPANVSIRSLLRLLREGPNLRERVTIPEGSRARAIGGILRRAADVDSVEFVTLALDPGAAGHFGVPGPTLEGYLFPETYEFSFGVAPREAAALLVAQYRSVMTPALVARAESLGLSERDVVTLASIIEAETAIPEERPRVAAVYLNRLRRGWRLEADPTVRYATGSDTAAISAEDLACDSPYNTYRIAGLPPGPIGNPGRASILAALYPSERCEDLFFVANGEGGHTFSRTADEHARAVAAFRRSGPPTGAGTGP